VINFLKEGMSRWRHSKQILFALILMGGTFVPWLAIDILWFDDFFLMQAYVICGMSMGYGDETDALMRS
jgi:hypothetical protein